MGKKSKDAYFQRSRPEIAELITTHPSKVLEIGCGMGGFQEFITNDAEYWGVEPAENAAEVAKKRLYKVLCGTYEETFAELPDDYFDLIICNDVIEHMASHDFFFQTIKSKMTSSGHLVGSIPNVRYITNLKNLLLKRDWEYEDAGILDRTHLRFFTERSLKKTILSHDFEIKIFSRINKIKLRIHPFSRLVNNILILLMGQDTRALQFGFCLKKKSVEATTKFRS